MALEGIMEHRCPFRSPFEVYLRESIPPGASQMTWWLKGKQKVLLGLLLEEPPFGYLGRQRAGGIPFQRIQRCRKNALDGGGRQRLGARGEGTFRWGRGRSLLGRGTGGRARGP